jgi:hypothetical protein
MNQTGLRGYLGRLLSSEALWIKLDLEIRASGREPKSFGRE